MSGPVTASMTPCHLYYCIVSPARTRFELSPRHWGQPTSPRTYASWGSVMASETAECKQTNSARDKPSLVFEGVADRIAQSLLFARDISWAFRGV
eukprot:1337196-Amphidinium_carterae.1